MGHVPIILNVQRDQETDCAYDCGDRHDYQQCRQAYYLKQQNQIIKQQPSQAPTSTNQALNATTSGVNNDKELNSKVLLLEQQNADLAGRLSQQSVLLQSVIISALLIGVTGISVFFYFFLKTKFLKK